MSAPYHPIFERFGRFEGHTPEGYQSNWLGVRTRVDYANWGRSEPWSRPDLPDIDTEEYLEWIDLLTAVSEAGDRFTMVELGAGFGRWLVNGAVAYRKLRPDGALRLVGVEAEPTHFAWMRDHMAANGIDPKRQTLVEAAVAGERGRVIFGVGDPAGWWGQSISRTATRKERRPESESEIVVKAVTLSKVLRRLRHVDLIDLDVQGAEADVLAAAEHDLERVRRVHVGTHGEEPEQRLRDLFARLGWESLADYPAGGEAAETEWGGRDVRFQDGVQSWRNPAR